MTAVCTADRPGGPLPSSFPALLAAPRASLRVLRVAHALLSDGLGSELVKRLRGGLMSWKVKHKEEWM